MGREVIITIGTTATKILDQSITRKEITIQNQGAATVYLGISENVAVSGTRKGRELAAGVIETINSKDDPELIKERMYGIVAAGTVDVWVWEA